MTSSIRFVDLFAGVGGFRLAFEQAGARCFFSSEINRYAQITYEANFGERPHGDIYKIASEEIPDFDVLCAGFPCQPFSIAGVSKKNSLGRKHGFDDETQGPLFFEIVRILEWHLPEAFLLENVKNLQAHDGGRTFKTIRRSLEQLGYRLFVQLINARWWVPQKRERVYIVGFRDPVAWSRFVLRFEAMLQGRLFDETQTPTLGEILEKAIPSQYTLQDKTWAYLQRHAADHRAAGNGFGFRGFADLNGPANTLTARYGRDGAEILIEQPGRNPRRLTPRECARLMGYPDDFRIVVSDSQAYRQFGNSVVVPVVRIFAEAIVHALSDSGLTGSSVGTGICRTVRQKSR